MTTFGRTVAGVIVTLYVASAANAQSSVTLYGIADTPIQYISNVGGHALFQDENTHGPHIFGLKGVEDPGGGLRTIFDLENEYLLNNDQALVPGTLFNRKAYVGHCQVAGPVA